MNNRVKSKNKFLLIMIFGGVSLVLGFIAGTVLWLVLQIINFGTQWLWETLPQNIFGSDSISFWYYLVICLIGAVLIGLLQIKNGLLPDETEEVIGTIKKTGKYPYKNLKKIIVAAILPIVFGGVLGPEAGLVGVVAGLSFWVTDSLKYRGEKLTKILGKDFNSTMSETGIAVVLSTVFGAPLFGLVNNLEPDTNKETYVKKLLAKKDRIFIYAMGIIGGVIAVILMGRILNLLGLPSSSGIPRFGTTPNFQLANLPYTIPLILAGIAFALIYLLSDKITKKIAEKFADKRILSCVIAGLCLAVAGYLLPYVMFSGEHQMDILMENWESMSILILLTIAAVKLIMLNVCVNFGWRGGGIFPIIFSGVALGYGMALLLDIDGTFSIAISLSAMYGYISKKPATTAAFLLLCFPFAYIPPIIISAFIASKVPSFKRHDTKLIESVDI